MCVHAQNHVASTQCFRRERHLRPAPFMYAYANDVKYDGCSVVHTLHGLRHLFGGLSLCLKNALRKQRIGRKYVRESAYLANLHILGVNPRTRP